MATPREVRKLAFQVLYQLDARSDSDIEHVRASLEPTEGLSAKECDKAFEMGRAAFEGRAGADAEILELAPTWPSHRLAAVDRAILRLAWWEMTSGKTQLKVAVNEAVELAKEFSTEKSPAFVNGVLDRVLKRLELERAPAGTGEEAVSS